MCKPTYATSIFMTELLHLVTYVYRIRKKFRGGFNFVVFMDDKDPRIFFIKKAMIHEMYYTFYLQVGGETNNIMRTVSAHLS